MNQIGREGQEGDERQDGTYRMHAIRSVAVLGAGTMGAQIAAHIANAGMPALLLDLTNDVAREGLKRARALKPDPFFTPDAAALVTIGGFDSDLASIATVDWIVEAVVERLDVKRALFGRPSAGPVIASISSIVYRPDSSARSTWTTP